MSEETKRNMFPTHVGMNRDHFEGGGELTYVPHTRGDEPISLEGEIDKEGCSPHTWG